MCVVWDFVSTPRAQDHGGEYTKALFKCDSILARRLGVNRHHSLTDTTKQRLHSTAFQRLPLLLLLYFCFLSPVLLVGVSSSLIEGYEQQLSSSNIVTR